MRMIGKYLLSVIAVSLLIALCKLILPSKGVVGAVLKLVCGVLLAFTFLTPFQSLDLGGLQNIYTSIQSDAAGFINDGEEIAKSELKQSIAAELSAYILDKATAMDLDLEIQLLLTEDSLPQLESVKIKGDASPYAKKQLVQIICEDLGISEESVQWH